MASQLRWLRPWMLRISTPNPLARTLALVASIVERQKFSRFQHCFNAAASDYTPLPGALGTELDWMLFPKRGLCGGRRRSNQSRPWHLGQFKIGKNGPSLDRTAEADQPIGGCLIASMKDAVVGVISDEIQGLIVIVYKAVDVFVITVVQVVE